MKPQPYFHESLYPAMVRRMFAAHKRKSLLIAAGVDVEQMHNRVHVIGGRALYMNFYGALVGL